MFLSGMLARRRTPVKAAPFVAAARATRWLPPVFWMAGIFYLSHQSAPMGVTVRPWESIVAHLGLYGALAVLFCWALGTRPKDGRLAPRRMLVAAFALTVLYGVGDELHQAFVPGRAASLADASLDAAGAALGITLALMGSVLLRRRARAQPGVQSP